ncbi:hypothetical protein Taro_033073 [Colocasia esculenta]|uniref:Uncharacterized protein n=1 Tax=Colocasia esculenta TaxID=4460 RepID=A0A843W3P9_COLES|nr:hypothetical protein [Colocasia esculenta]
MVQPTRRPCGNPWSEEIYGGLGEKGVDTGSSSVDTGSSSVDTGSSSVDTRDPSQKSFVPVWDRVSTHPMGRSTHSGNFSTISHIWTCGTLGIL